jgi:hypothetical protein
LICYRSLRLSPTAQKGQRGQYADQIAHGLLLYVGEVSDQIAGAGLHKT